MPDLKNMCPGMLCLQGDPFTLGPARIFLRVPDYMGPTPETRWVPRPGFYFDFYTDYG